MWRKEQDPPRQPFERPFEKMGLTDRQIWRKNLPPRFRKKEQQERAAKMQGRCEATDSWEAVRAEQPTVRTEQSSEIRRHDHYYQEGKMHRIDAWANNVTLVSPPLTTNESNQTNGGFNLEHHHMVPPVIPLPHQHPHMGEWAPPLITQNPDMIGPNPPQTVFQPHLVYTGGFGPMAGPVVTIPPSDHRVRVEYHINIYQ